MSYYHSQWGYVTSGDTVQYRIVDVTTIIPYESDIYAISIGTYTRSKTLNTAADIPSAVVNSTISKTGFKVQVDDYTEGIWWITFGIV